MYADLAIATIYAYLLFTIDPNVSEVDLRPHLFGYILLFAAYVGSGVLRRMTHGPQSSRLAPIASFLGVYTVLWFIYSAAFRWSWTNAPSAVITVNLITIAVAGTLMFAYREIRRRLRNRSQARKGAGLIVGIDIDGVLADQIVGVLPTIRRKYGITLTREDITEWELPIANSNIAKEIKAAQSDPKYMMRMPVHDGARELMTTLFRNNRVLVLTARDPATADVTTRWLRKSGLPFDDVSTLKEAEKSAAGTDVLIDDYLGNVIDFLVNTNGIAILVDQPWNRSREALAPHVSAGRILFANSLNEIAEMWPQVAHTVMSAGVRQRGRISSAPL